MRYIDATIWTYVFAVWWIGIIIFLVTSVRLLNRPRTMRAFWLWVIALLSTILFGLALFTH